ncbi:MAG TPA: hypothetical protein VM865_08095 [Acidobacteriaceae bacterium]|nr:hypothetical protein [Acidobacteriaceae bacterium]
MAAPLDDPAEQYRARASSRGAEARHQHRKHVQLGYVRLLLALAIISVGWMALHAHAFSAWWVLLPCAAFVLIARLHSAVLRQEDRAERAATHCRHGLARIEERWAELPARQPHVDLASSLFAEDLDLFGRGGLFNLLCSARTSLGEDALATSLLHPPDRTATLARQDAVRELRQRFDLREELASLPGPDVAPLDADSLASWSAVDTPALPGWLAWLAPALLFLTLGAALRYAVTGSPILLVLAVMVDASLTYGLQKRTDTLLAGAERAARSLRLTSALIRRLQADSFDAPLLRDLQQTFSPTADSSRSAAHALDHLAILAEMIDYRRNGIVRILDAPLLYTVQLGAAVQRWRRAHGAHLGPWLRALGELEALLSLATYSFEHPADPFPEILDGPAAFEAEALGHPLLPAAKCVRNDVALGPQPRLLLVSGSNMSGKSTLLRAVGINTVLAMAGAPVRAARLRLTPLHLGASIQVHDSLQGGQSRFYAEILRLRAICTLAEEHPPVLFLLDEVLAGTNSSDRLAGAQGIAHALLATGAVGLISTHDLTLTGLGGTSVPGSSSSDPTLRNVHFEDHIEDGAMLFDFKLRDGVVTRRNGLELMRLVGLKV